MYNEDDQYAASHKLIDELRLEIAELMNQDQLSEGNLRRIDYLEGRMNAIRDRMW